MQVSTDVHTSANHAVVIGGSMAGLLAARVLSEHFARVTVIERDRFPDGPAFRAGVPQSRHVHVLLARGRQLLEQLFPGLSAELQQAGAVILEAPVDALWLSPAGWWHRTLPGTPVLSLSRQLLEWGVRHRLQAEGRIRFWDTSEVAGLRTNADRTAVEGVYVRRRPPAGAPGGDVGQDTAVPEGMDANEVAADLVVDASGRHSRAPAWLEELGYVRPRETHVNAFLGYASRTYAVSQTLRRDWKLLYLMAQAPLDRRVGVVAPLEGDRWIVTLGGYGRDYPPTDDAGFVAFARSLRNPILYDTIKDAEPLSGIFGYRDCENQMRHYERLPHRPEHFVVLGDAACAFNPVYGQGMTVAALGAMTLDQCLREQRRDALGGAGLAGRFQKRLARTNQMPWIMATGEDLRYSSTTGPRPSMATRLMQRYLDRFIRVAMVHPTVSRAFSELSNLLAPPTVLFRPSVLIPTLREGGRYTTAGPQTETGSGVPIVNGSEPSGDWGGSALATGSG